MAKLANALGLGPSAARLEGSTPSAPTKVIDRENHMNTTFPDKEYLQKLVEHLRTQYEEHHDVVDELVMLAGATLKWDGDFFTDANVQWSKEEVRIDDVTLTGLGPEWNAIVIDRCQRDPKQLRALLQSDSAVAEMAAKLPVGDMPILVRVDGEKKKTLDGMKRVIAAIRDGRENIEAFVARTTGTPKPECEAHVVYDLLRSYDRGINTDRKSLIAALQYLRKSYSNVDTLLRERFGPGWIYNDDIRAIIEEALRDNATYS